MQRLIKLMASRWHCKITLVLTLSALLLVSCSTGSRDGIIFNTPDIQLHSIKPTGFANGKLNFDIGLRIKNNNKYLLDITNIASDISLNDVVFMKSVNDKDFPRIEANSEAIVVLKSNLDGAVIKKMLTTLNLKAIDYKMSGKVGFNQLIDVPFAKEGTVSIEASIKKYLPLLSLFLVL